MFGTSKILIALAFVAGCGLTAEEQAQPDWWDSLPDAEFSPSDHEPLAAPPPPVQLLHLDLPALELDTPVDFTIRGGAPNETLFLGGSLQGIGNGPCPGALAPLCLDITQPKIVGTGVADASGTAVVAVTIPSSKISAGTTLSFQAVANRGPDSIKSDPAQGVTTAEDCDNGFDDDNNGLADCEDAGCSAAPNCFEDCADGVDNDADGMTDCNDDECWSPDCHSGSVVTTVQGGMVNVQETIESWWWAGCGLVLGMDELYEADMSGIWGTVEVDSPQGNARTTCTWEFDVGAFDFHHTSYFNFNNMDSRESFDLGPIQRAGFSVTPGSRLDDSSFLPKELSFWGRTAKVAEDLADPWGNPAWYTGGTLTSNDSSWQNTFNGACGSTMVIYHDNSFTRDPTGESDDYVQ